ncbi:MAG: anti-sigma factor [Acidobacteriota bacterium]
MNCERCQIELEDFLYGELAERLAAEVREHLAGCNGCAAERNRLESENALFAEFYEQTAIDPSAEMWRVIRARIKAEPVRQPMAEEKPSWWQTLIEVILAPAMIRQVAVALLLIAISVATTIFLMRHSDDGKNIARQEPTPTPQIVATPSPAPTATSELAQAEPDKTSKPVSEMKPKQAGPSSDHQILARQLVRTEREYQNAIKLLDRAVAKRRNGIEPEAFKKYESSLALIDSSIAQSKRALRELPNDLVAGQFLLAAYARKVELMQEIAMQ